MHTWIQQNGHRRPRSHQEEPVKRHHRKEAIGEEMQTGRRRFVACSVSGCGSKSSQYLSLSRIGEADNPGPAHATTKLFGDQFEAIGQWARNLTSKSEMELTPLLAQFGKCRQMFSESFEKESPIPTPHRSVRTSQALTVIWILLPLPISTEPGGDSAHI